MREDRTASRHMKGRVSKHGNGKLPARVVSLLSSRSVPEREEISGVVHLISGGSDAGRKAQYPVVVRIILSTLGS